VGWGSEPAFAGFPNTVQLILRDSKDKGVADLGDTLTVDVTYSGKTTSLSFEPFFEIGEFGTVGDYRAKVIPTRAGTYEFRINGTIKGDKIDQKFTCSQTTFDCVDDPSEVEFPVQDPPNAQLADRITKEATRVTKSTKEANDAAKLAKTLGYIGVGLGAVALIVALLRGRGSKKTAA